MGEQNVCLNCGEPGSHYAPPSLGEQGFYMCGPGKLQQVIEAVDGSFVPGRSVPPGMEHVAARLAKCAALTKYANRRTAKLRTGEKPYHCPYCKAWHVHGRRKTPIPALGGRS